MLSIQEREFLEEKKENDKQIDGLLDDVSANLSRLKSIAMDINVGVSAQNDVLDDITVKMEDTQDHIDTTNRRLVRLADKYTGGCGSVCCCVCSIVVALSLLGLILHMVW